MKTHFIRQFQPTARQQVDSVLALSGMTRESCQDLIGELRALIPTHSALLAPFADLSVEDAGDISNAAKVQQALATFSSGVQGLIDQAIALCPPLIDALQEHIVDQQVLEFNLRRVTDEMLGLPAPAGVSQEEEAKVVDFAHRLQTGSAGDGSFTEADGVNAVLARDRITASRGHPTAPSEVIG